MIWWWTEYLPVVRDLRAEVSRLEIQYQELSNSHMCQFAQITANKAAAFLADTRAEHLAAENMRLRALLGDAYVRGERGRFRKVEVNKLNA